MVYIDHMAFMIVLFTMVQKQRIYHKIGLPLAARSEGGSVCCAVGGCVRLESLIDKTGWLEFEDRSRDVPLDAELSFSSWHSSLFLRWRRYLELVIP